MQGLIAYGEQVKFLKLRQSHRGRAFAALLPKPRL
jgi:hypothetical protein